MSAEEYLAWEREQPTRHAFDSGETFAMAGASPRHNALCADIIRDLGMALRGGDCRVLTSDQRVSLRHRKKYVYSDAIVVCDRPELEEGTRDVMTNPRAVFEVLSASTEVHDRGDQWEAYRPTILRRGLHPGGATGHLRGALPEAAWWFVALCRRRSR
jgi:Uma2 family endonuclease